jgi:hypothetical protein
MLKLLEQWGKDHPVLLTIASVIVGALVAFLPVAPVAYLAGRDQGVAASDANWRKKFDATVADQVKIQVPKEFKSQFESVASADREKDTTIDGLNKKIMELQSSLQQVQQDSSRKSAIYSLLDDLISSARNINANLQRAKASKDAGFLTKERQSFLQLLAQIHDAHEKGGRWVSLFDDLASALYLRTRDAKPISDEEIIAFLSGFTENPEGKKRIVDDLAQVGVQAREIRD